MTARAKCILEGENGFYPYKPIKLEVHRHGTRAVDTAKATFAGRIESAEGSPLYVVLDNFDMDHLAGLWNFQRHGKDESGRFNHLRYNRRGYIPPIEPSLTTYEIHHRQNYFSTYSGSGIVDKRTVFRPERITSTDLTSGHIRATDNIPAPDEFDYYIWMVTDHYDTRINWRRLALFYFGGESILHRDFGVFTHRASNGNLWFSLYDQNAVAGTPINYESSRIYTRPFLLRITGKKTNALHTIKMYVNGVLKSTLSLRTAMRGISPHIWSEIPGLGIFHMRVYSRILSDSEAARMLRTVPPVLSMKFGGRIWKKEETVSSTAIQAQSFGQDIIFSVIQFPDSLTGNTYVSGTFKSNTGNYGNATTPLAASHILSDMLYRLDFDMINTSTNNYTMFGDARIRRPVLPTLSALTALSNTTIVSDPNRLAYYEDADGIPTNHVALESQSCHIEEVDKDSATLVNEITMLPEGTTNQIVARSQSSIEQHGHRERKMQFGGFVSVEDNSAVVQNILDTQSVLRPRYEVVQKSYVNHLRENNVIHVVDPQLGISGSYKIYSMSWYYPNIMTVINCGQHRFDAFDTNQTSKIDLTELKYAGLSASYPIWIEKRTVVPYVRGRTSADST